MYAVCQRGSESADGTWFGVGQPPAQATATLVSLHPTKNKALTALVALEAETDQEFECWYPGDPRLKPVFEVREFDAEDYYPRQVWRESSRKDALRQELVQGVK